MRKNVRSIAAVRAMNDSLALLALALESHVTGLSDQARPLFRLSTEEFLHGWDRARAAVSEPGEDEIVAGLRGQFAGFWRQAQAFLATSPTGGLDRDRVYTVKLVPAIRRLIQRTDDLLAVNQAVLMQARPNGALRRACETPAIGLKAVWKALGDLRLPPPKPWAKALEARTRTALADKTRSLPFPGRHQPGPGGHHG